MSGKAEIIFFLVNSGFQLHLAIFQFRVVGTMCSIHKCNLKTISNISIVSLFLSKIKVSVLKEISFLNKIDGPEIIFK